MGDGWHVGSQHDGVIPSLLERSLLDRQAVEEIMTGQRPFPRYADVPLPPERQLLHELIVQVVTERRVDADHVPGQVSEYDARLAATIKDIAASEAYQRLALQGSTDRAAVTALLDAAGVERLPSVDALQRTTLMIAAGGPGTGKSSLVRMLARDFPEIYRDAAKVNTAASTWRAL